MAQIQVVPVLRQRVKCQNCKYEWYSSSRAQKRICCARCRGSVTVSPQKVRIPKGIPFDEEMKVINGLPAEQKIRYYLALAREAESKAEREVALTAAHNVLDEEAERGKGGAS